MSKNYLYSCNYLGMLLAFVLILIIFPLFFFPQGFGEF